MEQPLTHDEIYLTPDPDIETYAIKAFDMIIHTCRVYEISRDSGKIESRIVANYGWESKIYDGRLVAVHKEGNYVAYILHNRNACSVRVLNRVTKVRALIKNFVGQAVDIAWAFTTSPILLAISDEGGNVTVYSVEQSHDSYPDDSIIHVKTYLHLERSATISTRTMPHRLTWCPFVPDPSASNGTNDEVGFLLTVYYGSTVDLLNVNQIAKRYGVETTFAEVDHPAVHLDDNETITCVGLAPDSTALALSTDRGEVRFYTLEDGKLRFAQQWNPHKGRPVTSIVFLDNIISAHPDDLFWKYALTSCDGNRELKLWNCEHWECLGTLRITPPDISVEASPLVLTTDWTSSYVFLSDIQRKSLYIVEIRPTFGVARFLSFTELPLLHPALSLAVMSAEPKRFYNTSPGGGEEIEEAEKSVGVYGIIYAVNPKSLLELHIKFVPPRLIDVNPSDASSIASLPVEESFSDELSDLSREFLHAAPQIPEIIDICDNICTENDSRARQSTPTASPGDQTPTRELEMERRVSASPSSQEVSKILSMPLTAANEEVTFVADASNSHIQDRPQSPAGQTLLSLVETPVVSAWRTDVSKTDDDAISQQPSSVMVNSLTRLTMDVEGVISSVMGQENDLKLIKETLASQQIIYQKMNNYLQRKEAQEKQERETLRALVDHTQSVNSVQFMQALAQTLQDSLQKTLETSLKTEMRTIVDSYMNEMLETIKLQLRTEVAEKLSATDSLLRDNIGKMMKSKPVLDAIGNAAGQAVSHTVAAEAHTAYKETFQKIVVPSFENIARTLFTQMNDTFQRGTKEYLDQLERQLRKTQASGDEWKKTLTDQITSATEQLKVATAQHAASSEMQKTLCNNVKELLKEEVAKGIADGQRNLNDVMMKVLRSQAPTPVSSVVDRQQIIHEVNQQLNGGQINAAFQQALQARDISVVTYVCNRMDPTKLFSQSPCPLQQPVIISLLHQLAADLANQPVIKLKYIQEAIPSLDPKSCAPEMAPIIKQVQEKLNAFLSSNTGTLARQAKMSLMLLDSVLS